MQIAPIPTGVTWANRRHAPPRVSGGGALGGYPVGVALGDTVCPVAC